MGEASTTCSGGPWPITGWNMMACTFAYYGYSITVMMAILSAYLIVYFRGKTVWIWLFVNCIFMFLGQEILTAINATPTASPIAVRILNPICLIFFSISEMGDIILFYERYKIVKRTPMEKWFYSLFFGFFSCAAITRLADVVIAAVQGQLHSRKTEGGVNVQYIEPTYLLFLLCCEILLQIRYIGSVSSFKSMTKATIAFTLLRSAGARFMFILLPMFARIVTAYIYLNIDAPTYVMMVAFSTTANLFTMFDLLMLKIELGASRSKSGSGTNSGWGTGPVSPRPIDTPTNRSTQKHLTTTHLPPIQTKNFSTHSKMYDEERATGDSYVLKAVSPAPNGRETWDDYRYGGNAYPPGSDRGYTSPGGYYSSKARLRDEDVGSYYQPNPRAITPVNLPLSPFSSSNGTTAYVRSQHGDYGRDGSRGSHLSSGGDGEVYGERYDI
ncbi:hypothetical protein HDV00_008066 [Rhizophlyctis rosea]|nr:hypothetical protein HDV00_008066 [Rhizophlyctis rosea]